MELKWSRPQKKKVIKTVLTFLIGVLFGLTITLVLIFSLQIYKESKGHLKPVDYVVARAFRGSLTFNQED